MGIDYRPDDRVLAQWDGGRFWFPGAVHGVNGGSVAVRYDDGMSDIRPANQVKPFDWEAGSRIDAIWAGDGRYYAARIMAMGADGRTIEVRFDDGIREKVDSSRCRSE